MIYVMMTDSEEDRDDFVLLYEKYRRLMQTVCDIDLEQQYVRTKETAYVPRNYYDNAFTKLDERGM